MSGVLFSNPLARQLSVSGAILPGWTAAFYVSETMTPTDVYSDGDLNTPIMNPVEADADGHMPAIYLDPDVVYRVIMKDSSGVMVPDGDVDPIDVSRGSGGGGGAPDDATYITVDDETSDLPSSRQLIAGEHVTLDVSEAGELTINSSDGGSSVVGIESTFFNANVDSTDQQFATFALSNLALNDILRFSCWGYTSGLPGGSLKIKLAVDATVVLGMEVPFTDFTTCTFDVKGIFFITASTGRVFGQLIVTNNQSGTGVDGALGSAIISANIPSLTTSAASITAFTSIIGGISNVQIIGAMLEKLSA